MSNNIQTQAAANALSGERTHHTISFPITGDRELDFIAAIIALSIELPMDPACATRACEYLRDRFKAQVIDFSKAMGQFSQPVPSTPWATSAGCSLPKPNNLGGYDMPPVYDPAITCETKPDPVPADIRGTIDNLRAQHAQWKADNTPKSPFDSSS